jgi:hypothetical protein
VKAYSGGIHIEAMHIVAIRQWNAAIGPKLYFSCPQKTLGIFTLLPAVQTVLALSHQAGVILEFRIALYHLHCVQSHA